MHYIKTGQGAGGPWPLTDDRTASPNSKWKPEQLALHGFELVPDPVAAPTVEELIATKTRELAVAALKTEGKLDQAGKIPKEEKPK